MASLSSIRSGIATNLGNISSLTVFGFVPDSIEPPTAVVGVVDNIEYDSTMARGADTYSIPQNKNVYVGLIRKHTPQVLIQPRL